MKVEAMGGVGYPQFASAGFLSSDIGGNLNGWTQCFCTSSGRVAPLNGCEIMGFCVLVFIVSLGEVYSWGLLVIPMFRSNAWSSRCNDETIGNNIRFELTHCYNRGSAQKKFKKLRAIKRQKI